MEITRQSLQERRFLLAQHYLARLNNFAQMHSQGQTTALEALHSFDQEWQQLQAQQHWAAQMALYDKRAAALVAVFPDTAQTLLLQVDTQEALQWVDDALQWVDPNDLHMQYRLLRASCQIRIRRHNAEQALEHLNQLERVVERLNDDNLRMNVVQLQVDYAEMKGDFANQLAWSEQALALAQRLEDEIQIATAYQKMGFACTRMGQPDRANTCLRAALDLFQKLGLRLNVGFTYNSLAANYFYWHKAEDALPYAEQALVIMQEFGRREAERRIFANMALYTIFLGDLQKALQYGQQAFDLAIEVGARSAEYTAFMTLLVTAGYLGLVPEATQYIEHAKSYLATSEIPDNSAISSIEWTQWIIAYEQGDMGTACESARQSLLATRQREDKRGEYIIAGFYGNSLCELGDWDAAAQAFANSLDFPAGQYRNPQMRATLAGYSYVQAKRGETEHAQKLLDEMIALIVEHSLVSLDPPFITGWNAYRAAVCLGDSRAEMIAQEFSALITKHLHYLHDERLRNAYLSQYTIRAFLAARPIL